MDELTRLAQAAEGLLFSSESDYPLEPFVWTESVPFSPDMLYTLTSLPEGTPVTPVDVATFFMPMVRRSADDSEDTRKRIARFRILLRLVQRLLDAPMVYKLGTIEIPAFIVGRLPDGRIGGLRTMVVET